MHKRIHIAAIAIVILVAATGICGCGDPMSTKDAGSHFDTIMRRHFNILIVPDLSNRQSKDKLPQSDVSIVQQFASMIYPDIITYKRLLNQEDIFRIDLINKDTRGLSTFEINLKRFGKDQVKRNNYLGIYEPESGFKKDTAALATYLKSVIAQSLKTPEGADIFSYLDNLNYLRIDTNITDEPDSQRHQLVRNYHDNIIVLLTDGYIETSIKYPQEYSLPATKINAFRNTYLAEKKTTDTTIEGFLQQHREFAITQSQNSLLKHTRILILQLYDRGQFKGSNQHPGLTDVKIMKLIWKDWLTNSGVKPENIEMHTCDETNNAQNIQQVFSTFLKLK